MHNISSHYLNILHNAKKNQRIASLIFFLHHHYHLIKTPAIQSFWWAVNRLHHHYHLIKTRWVL